jgi:hypothetical protein
MRFVPCAPFKVAHVYKPGQSPKDEHPPKWPPLKRELTRFGTVGGVAVVVRSTPRRKDGWSYNVAEERDRAAWIGYYHHGPSGRRIRAANSPNAMELAQLFDAL